MNFIFWQFSFFLLKLCYLISHLTNEPLSTDGDCWKGNVRYGFGCCSESSYCGISLPDIVCLVEREDFFLLIIRYFWFVFLNYKSNKMLDHCMILVSSA